ncbi:hypothetical protein MSG28_002962 [Choristoneura fumiferana]|uniref:Uncharacterized protein n=1 Tax=Choristoneura fumiferana TaxID=7141 RepID=A0ACC0JK59_CHOFU|nr:hypothetical protein MSG28_002962 [Choristoneura fumiferana]
MNDPKSYQKVNNMPRKDVNEILQQSPIKWKEKNARIMDIGCGDGSVTMEIWQKFMPKNFLELVGCDINENNIIFAQEHYGSENVKFIWLDIQGGVPDELKGRVAFTNVYDMLAEGGNCLIIFLGRNTVYEIYDRLSRQLKWNEDLTHVRTKFLSPYFDSKDPESELRNTMERIGFKDINVRAPLKTFIFDGGVNEFRDLMKCLNPFDSLKAKWEEFMDDYEKLNPDAGTIEYRLIIAYGSK